MLQCALLKDVIDIKQNVRHQWQMGVVVLLHELSAHSQHAQDGLQVPTGRAYVVNMSPESTALTGMQACAGTHSSLHVESIPLQLLQLHMGNCIHQMCGKARAEPE